MIWQRDYIVSLMIILAILILLSPAYCAGNSNRLIVDYHKQNLFLALEYEGRYHNLEIRCDSVEVGQELIILTDSVRFAGGDLIWGDLRIPLGLFKVAAVEMISRGRAKIEFEIRSELPRRRVPADIVTHFDSLPVTAEQFVRGDVISIGGAIDIYGEVSKSVICFFSDVTLHSKSVVRGDVIAICGRVYRHVDSQIYGEVVSTKGWERGGRHFGSRRGYYDQWSLKAGADYNRVDGLFLQSALSYEDPDHVFPSISVGWGYALELERSRYFLSFAQRIFSDYALEPFGKLYRQTATEDDWICGKHENFVYALVVNEDFRDYYEQEGGAVGLRFLAGLYGTLELQYSYDQLGWLDAHPKLWSLFGKKDFRANFSTLPHALKETYKNDFGGNLSLFKVSYSLDTRMTKFEYDNGWLINLAYEKGGGDLKGDLTYSRWIVSLARHQSLGRYFAINLRGVYGGSSDHLPLFKKFFLGGLRTLPGYRHKEFYGDQMILGNLEYVIRFSRQLDGQVLFNIGKSAGQKDKIFSEGEFKSDIGLGLSFMPGFSLQVVKALDRSDSDLRLWVLFARAF